MVGNPPWDEVTVERLGFFLLHRPGLQGLPQAERDEVIAELGVMRPELASAFAAEQARVSAWRDAVAVGEYEPTAGDPDLYKYFCQRYRLLVREGGAVGVVLPRSAFVAQGSEGFREWLYTRTSAERVDFLVNSGKWMFDTHPQYGVALVVGCNRTPAANHRVATAGPADSPEAWRAQSSAGGVAAAASSFPSGWLTPKLRSGDEADLLAKVRVGSRFPTGSSGAWKCFPVRELDETNDKRLWLGATEGRPLWKGESFDQFDPRGTEQRLCPLSDKVREKVHKPRPGAKSLLATQMHSNERRQAVLHELSRARVAFRDVSRSDDSRTVRACLMPGRPYLLDNRGDDTRHADALSYLLDDLASSHRLSVATGYVNLGGLHYLAAAVADGRKVRLLFGAAPPPGLGGQPPMPQFNLALEALREDRDMARFPPSRAAKWLVRLGDLLQRPEVEVRRYTRQFLHGKAYLFGDRDDARAALVTSANLTGAGLFENLELGLVQYDPPVAARAITWFDELWDEAAEFKDELRDLLFPDIGLVNPREVYLRALLELLGPTIDAPNGAETTAVELAPFQRDGLHRALGILEEHHGVIYADGVGTGKTEIGLALVEEYVLRRGHHALVVAPAQLKSYWEERLDQVRLSAQVVSYHQLAGDEQLAEPRASSSSRHLSNDKDAYRLVVVDEGHALRTPDTTWYRAIARLLGGTRKDLALLTATPINNGLWDLYHLVMAFARHDRAFAAKGIRSLRRLFVRAGANERDPENLDPDVLFPLADMVSVRRDRRLIERNYPADTDPDERTKMLARFCPETVVRPGYEPPDGEVDLLLSNDVLSEGQNLQQAAAVISYDMPWNPQRVVQRYGRVIRLKSPHGRVYLRTMLPDEGDLELILQLETAIRRKIVAARPYGMEVDVIEGDVEEEIRSYARRLGDSDASLLDESDPGAVLRALSPEVLRAELRRAALEGEIDGVADLPWGVGAAFAQGGGVPSTGPPGIFFACRTRHGDRYWRYVTPDGDITSAEATILRRIDPGLAPGISSPPIDLEAAWRAAAASILDEHNEAARSWSDGPSVGGIQQWARYFLSEPYLVTSADAADAYDVLGVERGGAVRQALGAIKRELDAKAIEPIEAARRIVEVASSYGLRKVDPPVPVLPITEEDIGVVCWMAVLPAGG